MTTTEQPSVDTDQRSARPIERHPSDLLRLIIALGATIIGFFLATTLNELSEAITVEVIEGFDAFPNWVIIGALAIVAVLALFLPFIVIGYFIRKRQWRRLGLAVVAVIAALAVLWAAESFLVDRFSSPDTPFSPPAWVCEPGTTPEDVGLFTCLFVTDTDNPLDRYGSLVAATAFFAAIYPYLNRRWKRFGWITILVLLVIQMLGSLSPPTDEFLAVGIAFTIGTAILLIFGTPSRRPTSPQIVASLERAGVEIETLDRASVDARGSVPYIAATPSGWGLFVKVLTPEERSADILFRLFRMLRLRGVGDERPFSSLKRSVEHEAVVSLKARSDGVKTPRLEAVADIAPSSMVMAYELIDGTSLDSVPVEDLTDDVLVKTWELVGELRRRRTAHRDLRLANVFLDSAGEPWLIDFGFSELAATDGQLRSDVAELVTSTATVVGTERAVACAVRALGPEVLADAGSRVQPLALSGATRDAAKKQKGLLDDVRTEIETQTGIEPEPLESLERVKSRTVIMVLGFALAMYFLIPQLTQTDFGAVLDANWAWAPAIIVASFLTYVGAAYNIKGSVPDRIPLVPAVMVQFAGSFINRISPVKVGGMATNVRFLQKNGVELTSAIAGLGVSSVATFAVHMTLLITTVVFLGRNAGDFISLPSGNAVLVGLVVIFTLSGLVIFLPFSRKIFMSKVWPAIKRSGQGLAQVASTPSKAVMLFGGAAAMIVAYIAALWFSLEAFGGGLGVAAVALVFLGGQALGNLAPTPGGIGATEAALIAAMTALGLDATTAVSATFLYRIGTFWLPIVPGVFAFRKLESDDLL